MTGNTVRNFLSKNPSLVTRYTPLLRYLNPLVSNNLQENKVPFNSSELFIDGVTVASELTFDLPASQQTADNIIEQNRLHFEVIKGNITKAQAIKSLKSFLPAGDRNANAVGRNGDLFPGKLSKTSSITRQVEILENYDKTLKFSRSLNTKPKGISVFDFDDTLARTKEKVIVIKLMGLLLKYQLLSLQNKLVNYKKLELHLILITLKT